MPDKDPKAKDARPQAPTAEVKLPPVKNPRDAHPLSKAQPHRPGGHGFNPNSFSPKPIRNRNMGRSR